jgi:hypothetical protein
MILICGVFLYDTIPSAKSVFGMSIALIGVIIFTEENRQQQIRNQLKLQDKKEIVEDEEEPPKGKTVIKNHIVKVEKDKPCIAVPDADPDSKC